MSVSVELENIADNPQCSHGPTILFTRIVKNKKKRFYACAACRDRKDCNFFMWEDELENTTNTSDLMKSVREQEKRKYIAGIDHIKLFVTLNKIKNLSPNERIYCKTCCGFQLPKWKDNHKTHDIVEGVSDYNLLHPSEFLEPLDNAKKEAQFLFSKISTETITDMLRQLKIQYVLCIGTPRIHEYIINEVPDMTSLLLDFDKRFHSFYGPLEFCWYNLFNHYFFLPESFNVFKNFLQINEGNNLLLIMDPPFGGRIEPLAHTFTTINTLYKKLNNKLSNLPILLCFPYFMEPQILNSLPEFVMLDYKVSYDNHPLFRNEPEHSKRGSVVRIFTNINSSLIELPSDQGYKHCTKCDRWVATENKHCDFCKACTSKDGRTYVHCNLCERCVKPNWKHCEVCTRCAGVNHKCGEIIITQECFHCKEAGHKKRECPKVDHKLLKRKRTLGIKTKAKRKRKKFNISIKNLSPNERIYCKTCCGFQLPKWKDNHKTHDIVEGVSDYNLLHPSEFLEPLDNAKKEAQFLFSKISTETITDMLRQLKIQYVLCIGTPRIHEYIINEVPDMTSLLLDFDKRFHSFYGPLEFCWYNLFNHYFFLPESFNVFKNFLQINEGNNLLLIMDPPFGGRIEPLAHTFTTINTLYKKLNNKLSNLPILLCFPYFMEPQILNSLPEFVMLDYKVSYDNHPLFRNEPEHSKRGSVVRIFTNINSSLIELPSDQGYKHCTKCDRWVATENKHCDFCKACTSKDGRTYVHCNLCERCVKPNWKHCEVCTRCAGVNHKCGEIIITQECFHCKEAGHKKRECPKVDHKLLKRKRTLGIKTKAKRKRKKFNIS